VGSEGAPRQSALFSLLGGFDTRVPCYAGGIDLDLSVEALLSEIAGTPTAPCGLRRSNRPITHNVAGAPDYESGGQEFESLRARQQPIGIAAFSHFSLTSASTRTRRGSNMEAREA